jgi:histidinol-phosphate aminotransferase
LRPEYAAGVLDFSSNTNPYGPSPAVRAALANVPLDRYPDRQASALCDGLAERLGVPSHEIIAGNGSSELIALTALAFVRPGDVALVVGPTYGEYTRACRLVGGRVTTMQAHTYQDFQPHAEAIAAAIRHLQPRVVFVCNPNNPTGAVLAPERLQIVARWHPETLFVVDEAYQPFVPQLGSLMHLRTDNMLVLRSMTKDYGLAGLRLGYAVGWGPLVAALRQVQPPWSVSALAQAAGLAALGDEEHRQRSLTLLREAKADLVSGLRQLGLPPVPSATPFFLVRVGIGQAYLDLLLGRGFLVRDCASFNLPEYIRISTRRTEENERLLTAIREVKEQWPRVS